MHNIDENEVLRDTLSGLNEDIPPMPEGLHAAWMQKVEEDQMEKKMTRKSLTRFLSIAAAVVFVVGGTLLTRDGLAPADSLAYQDAKNENGAMVMYARTTSEYDDAVEDYAFTDGAAADAGGGLVYGARTMAEEPAEAEAAAEAVDMAATEKKIIRTATLTLYSQEYDASLATLRNLCENSGGWIESSSESTNTRTGLRSAYLTLRIPQSALDGYLVGTEGCGRVTYRYESAEDVTASYQDTQTRLATQLALMERLQALITESADLSDLLALESQIADTQYQIDRLTTSLNNTDRQVSYSTVSISLYEETAPALTDTTVTLGERITAAIRTGWDAFTGFMQDILVFLIAALPFIGIVVAVVIIIAIIRKIKRRNRE